MAVVVIMLGFASKANTDGRFAIFGKKVGVHQLQMTANCAASCLHLRML